MSSVLCLLVVTVLQNITLLGTIIYFADKKPKHLLNVRFALLFCCYSSLLYFVQKYNDSWIIPGILVVLSLCTCVTKIETKKSWRNSALYSAFGFIIANLTQIIIFTAFLGLKIELNIYTPNNITAVLYMLLALLLDIIVCLLPSVQKLAKKIPNISYALITMLLFLVVMYSLALFAFEQLKKASHLDTGLICSSITTALICFFVGGLILIEAAKDRKRKISLEAYNTYIPIVEQMITNIQKHQHLHNNQIQALSIYAKNKEWKKLQEAIGSISDDDFEDEYSYRFLHLKNQLLAGLLFCKYQEAKSKEIALNFTILEYDFDSNCTNFEIVDIAGILIENAIENSSPGDTIYLQIGEKRKNKNVLENQSTSLKPDTQNTTSEKSKFTICVENPGPFISDELLKNIFSTKHTRKKSKENHGLGLSILKTIINENGGNISVRNTHPDANSETYFSIKVEV